MAGVDVVVGRDVAVGQGVAVGRGIAVAVVVVAWLWHHRHCNLGFAFGRHSSYASLLGLVIASRVHPLGKDSSYRLGWVEKQ